MTNIQNMTFVDQLLNLVYHEMMDIRGLYNIKDNRNIITAEHVSGVLYKVVVTEGEYDDAKARIILHDGNGFEKSYIITHGAWTTGPEIQELVREDIYALFFNHGAECIARMNK